MSVLDVFICYINDSKLSIVVDDFIKSVIYNVFNRNDIPWNCTNQQIYLLKNNILNLSIPKQIYILQYLIDCEYDISSIGDPDYEKNIKMEKLLQAQNFYHLRPFLDGPLIRNNIPELEKIQN